MAVEGSKLGMIQLGSRTMRVTCLDVWPKKTVELRPDSDRKPTPVVVGKPAGRDTQHTIVFVRHPTHIGAASSRASRVPVVKTSPDHNFESSMTGKWGGVTQRRWYGRQRALSSLLTPQTASGGGSYLLRSKRCCCLNP